MNRVSLSVLLLSSVFFINNLKAGGDGAVRLVTNAISIGAGIAAGKVSKPEEIYKWTAEKYRKFEDPQREEGIITKVAENISDRWDYANLKAEFDKKYAPANLDTAIKVGVGIATFLVTKRVLKILR